MRAKHILTIGAALLCVCSIASAAVPKYIDVDVDYQQLQALPDLGMQQGMDGQLRFRLRSRGDWLDLTSLTGKWQARSNATASTYLESLSSVTSNSAHYIQCNLDSGETGTAVTNWVYSFILIDGAAEIPVGTGRYDVAAGTWDGAAATPVTNATLAAHIADTNNPHETSTSVVAAGTNVTVQAATVGSVTTYTVNSTDTDTTYTSGTNLTLVGGAFNLDAAAQASDDLADSALQNIVEDTTPQLGGNLDADHKTMQKVTALQVRRSAWDADEKWVLTGLNDSSSHLTFEYVDGIAVSRKMFTWYTNRVVDFHGAQMTNVVDSADATSIVPKSTIDSQLAAKASTNLATTTTAGLVEKATDAEASAGTDTNRFVTPLHLATYGGGMTYTDRGDLSAQDFSGGDFTTDNTWRDLDLSGIVGSNAVLTHIIFSVVENTAAGTPKSLRFRTNGNTNDVNRCLVFCPANTIPGTQEGMVYTDSDGVIEYKASNNTFETIEMTVKGWFE